MKTYQVSGKQLVILALVTSVFAASAVVFYDRIGTKLISHLAGAKSGEDQARTAPASVGGITDPSVATDEKNNFEVYRAMSPGVVNITSTTYVRSTLR